MKKKQILVVEDEAPIQELLRFNLERKNYAVQSAYSGEEALGLLKKQRPDLVLLDIMLPGTDGLEVCKIMKADSATSAIPIIILSALSEEADVVAGLELGADDYVAKPFSPRVLLARVKAALRRRSSETPPSTSELLQLHKLLHHLKSLKVLHDELKLLYL